MLFGKILVAYDGSKLSKKALQKAVSLAQEISTITRPTRLEVIHVLYHPTVNFGEAFVTIPVGTSYKYSEKYQPIIEEVKELIYPLEHVEIIIKPGIPVTTILEYAEDSGTDLIVMGSRGLSGIKEFFLGSVSHNVVQQAHIPVLIVK